MAKPTVQGTPTFNTSGYYVHIQVQVADDLESPAPGTPAPVVTMIRIWGESSKNNTVCYDARATTQAKIVESWPTLAWDSDDDWSEHWFLYDSEQAYYRICVEVTLSDGTQPYKCGVFKVPPSTQHGPLPRIDLTDC
jgi:hypothetical protein